MWKRFCKWIDFLVCSKNLELPLNSVDILRNKGQIPTPMQSLTEEKISEEEFMEGSCNLDPRAQAQYKSPFPLNTGSEASYLLGPCRLI